MQFTGEMMDELYGKEETNINVFGWLVRKPEAGLLGEITNKYIHGGVLLRDGIRGVAQMFDSPNWVDEFPPRVTTGVGARRAGRRPRDALLRWITKRFSLQFSDEVVPDHHTARYSASRSTPMTRVPTSTKSGRCSGREPLLLLGLIQLERRFRGAQRSSPTTGNRGPNHTTIVDVYNPNMPYHARRGRASGATHTARQSSKSRR